MVFFCLFFYLLHIAKESDFHLICRIFFNNQSVTCCNPSIPSFVTNSPLISLSDFNLMRGIFKCPLLIQSLIVSIMLENRESRPRKPRFELGKELFLVREDSILYLVQDKTLNIFYPYLIYSPIITLGLLNCVVLSSFFELLHPSNGQGFWILNFCERGRYIQIHLSCPIHPPCDYLPVCRACLHFCVWLLELRCPTVCLYVEERRQHGKKQRT